MHIGPTRNVSARLESSYKNTYALGTFDQGEYVDVLVHSRYSLGKTILVGPRSIGQSLAAFAQLL